VVMEINNLISKNSKLNTSKIDKQLIMNVPVDVRVVIADNTGGYGPEQFILKKAIKGKYRIYVNYYGDRQFTDAGPSTVMAEIFTKYSDKTEQRKIVSLQMSNAKKVERGNKAKVQVAEFEF